MMNDEKPAMKIAANIEPMAEWLGDGLQNHFTQVRILLGSPKCNVQLKTVEYS